MFDGSTDCSVEELELVYVRYLCEGRPRNVYLQIVSPNHAHAEGIFDAICACLDGKIAGWKDKLISFGTDGASVNLGANNSITTRFLNEQPYILPVHCIAHRLKLGVLAGVKQEEMLVICKEMLNKVHKHYHYSAKALREF